MRLLSIILGTALLATYIALLVIVIHRPRWFQHLYWDWAREEAAHYRREWQHWFQRFNELSNLAWDALVEDERGEDIRNGSARAKLRKFLEGGSKADV